MGEKWKQRQILFSWAPKSLQTVTTTLKLKDACSMEEKLDSTLKSRDITLPTKVHIVKAMVFPIVMYRCESWTRKKAECWIINDFELWCWRRLLRITWTVSTSKQLIVKESTLNVYWKDWCWSWRSNALATWCEEPTHWKRPWCWVRLMAGGEGDNRGWDG